MHWFDADTYLPSSYFPWVTSLPWAGQVLQLDGQIVLPNGVRHASDCSQYDPWPRLTRLYHVIYRVTWYKLYNIWASLILFLVFMSVLVYSILSISYFKYKLRGWRNNSRSSTVFICLVTLFSLVNCSNQIIIPY